MARGVTMALSTVPERVSVLETKVENIESKIDELKVDVKDLHDCLDQTRDSVMEQLGKMHDDSCAQHNELAGKIKDLEQFKQKWVYMVAGGIAVAGWVSGHMGTIAGFIK
jgi:uncharacterized coiled-coil protein SlyX